MAASEVNQLVEKHLSLVQGIARKVKKTLNASIEVDDLIGYGSKGLVEAAERFDARHGVAFTTFAYYRIRGAMYDGLRAMGWYSRADYARYRAEERANEYLRNRADREGAAQAQGGSAGSSSADQAATLAEVNEILSSVATVHITSIEAASSVPDESLPAPDVAVDSHRMSRRVREAVAALPDKERRLMELYYFADKNLEEAGAELGLSKSWACRLHARAVDLLRTAMGEET
ncbi:MAG TPA: sigma-70 family RNA polymerase sigma factor [Polyangia bacterium]|jgi:RNA polymerase sigma factor for flagellar operon FliA|nr:sigma-70 family RNA polymerase sigma factor [Polyangia bacterium]